MTDLGSQGEDGPESGGGWRTRRVPVDGLVFDLAEQGAPDGRPVVLLHGFPETHRCFDGLAARLAASTAPFRLLAPDQRGYSPGARPEDPAEYTLPRLAADVLGILDASGIEQADLVGHDWGAMVAWYLAARHPGRVRTLTAVSVPHPAAFAAAFRESPRQREMSDYFNLFGESGKAERVLLEDNARRLRDIYQPLPESAFAPYLAALGEPAALTGALNWYRAMRLGDRAPVPPVQVPAVYVWSTGDAAISRDAAELCAEHVTGPYRYVELEGVSHWVPDEAPDALAAVLPFLPASSATATAATTTATTTGRLPS